MKKQKIIKTLGMVIFTIFAFCMFTCKAGLGTAVDTQVPEIAITYPASSSVIRDDFVVTGTAKDETSIKSVTVSLVCNESTYGPFTATVDNTKNTWYSPVTVFGTTIIPDGKYTISATATDSAGRTSTSTTIYTIDNTQPIVAMIEPSTKGSGNAWEFGSELNMTGLQYDDNTAGKFTFTFYKEDGTKLGEYVGEDALSEWAIDIEEESTVFQAMKSNMTDVNTPENYWYTVKLEDSAYKYTDIEGKTVESVGNTTEWFYIWSDITGELRSGDFTPKISKLYNLDVGKTVESGTIPSSLTSAVLNSIKIQAEIIESEVSSKAGNFSIDPNNLQPTMTINDGDLTANPNYDESTNAFSNQVAQGASLRVEISPNKNGDSLLTSAMSVRRYELDENGDNISGSCVTYNTDTSDTTSETIEYTTGTTVVFYLEAPEEVASYRYIFSIEDIQDHLVRNGFYDIYVNAGAPQVSVSPNSKVAGVTPDSTKNYFVTTLTITDDSKLEPELQFYDNTSGESISLSEVSMTNFENLGDYEYAIQLLNGYPQESDSSYIYKYSVYIRDICDATDDEDNIRKIKYSAYDGKFISSSIKELLINYDLPILDQLTAPLTINSYTNIDDATITTSTTNIYERIEGTASDQYATGVAIAYTTTNTAPIYPTYGSDVTGESAWLTNSAASIDNENSTFNGTIQLPKDSNGNLVEGIYYVWVKFTDGTGYGSPKKACILKADTAYPVITSNIEDLSLVEYDGYRWSTGDSLTLSGKATDTFGIKSVTCEPSSGFSYDSSTGDWSYETTATGKSSIKITAKDEAGKETVVTYKIGLDSTAPSVSISKLNDTAFAANNWYSGNTFSVEAAASAGESGIASITCTDTISGGETITLNSTSKKGNISLQEQTINGKNAGEFYFTVTNNLGVFGESTKYVVYFDSDVPTFTTSPSGQVLVNKKNDLELTVNVTEDGSGIDSVKITKIGNTTLPLSITASLDNDEYKLTIPKDHLEAGYVRIEVTDIAGNTSSSNAVQLVVDEDKPTVTFSSPTTVATGSTGSSTVNKTITVSGTGTDNNTLTKVVLLRSTDNNSWTELETFTNAQAYNWSTTIDTTGYDNADGEGILYLKAVATDAAGNVSSDTKLTLNIDQNADRPIIEFNNINPILETTGQSTIVGANTVYGSVTDDDGTITSLQVSQNGTDWISTGTDDSTGKFSVNNGVFTYANADGDGDKQLYFRITDSKGTIFTTSTSVVALSRPYYKASPNNIDGTTSVYYRVDKTNPVIEANVYVTAIGSSFSATKTANTVFDTTAQLGSSMEKFKLLIFASDANGIDIVTAKTPNAEAVSATYNETLGGYVTGEMTFGSTEVSEYKNVEIVATDKSTLETSITRTCLVDTKVSTITVTSHEKGETVTADVIIKGTANDGTPGSGVKSVQYLIPTIAQVTEGVTSATTGWSEKIGDLSWELTINASTYGTDSYGEETVSGSGIYVTPIYFLITDNAGNENLYKDFNLQLNPNGDRPTTTIVYPANDDIVGGSIRVSGSAEDNEAVGTVYVQLDVDNDGDFDDDDKTALSSASYYSSIVTLTDGNWAIPATGTTSWSLVLNAKGELNPSGDGADAKSIRIRACSVDKKGTLGVWTDQIDPTGIVFKVDTNVPMFGEEESLKLVQYSEGTVIAEKEYTSGMWIKGDWYLEGSISDDTAVTSVTAAHTGNSNVTISYTEASTDVFTVENDSYKGYSMKIPLSTASRGTGTIEFLLQATDANSTVKETITINYDNTEPTVGTFKHGDNEIGSSTKIVQSDGAFEIKTTVTDDGSGFDRVMLYFLRQDSSGKTKRIYNPILDSDSRIDFTDESGNAVTNYLFDTDGVPRFTQTVTRGSTTTLSYTDLGSNNNISVGTMVKLGGVDRLITAIDGDVATIDSEVPTTYTAAEFAYALVIDHSTTETPNWNDAGTIIESITNDDGDGIAESATKSGTETTASVYINSNNIVDGKIYVYYAAYDAAGNVTIGNVETSVANNGPAITKVFLGTDLDGSGTVVNTLTEDNEPKSTEIIEYSATTSSKGVAAATITADGSVEDVAKFIAKDLTTVEPEFVGGNGDLYYYLTIGENAISNDKMRENGTVSPASITVAQLTTYESTNTTDTANAKTLLFTVWDSTEEGIVGSTTLSATATVKMFIDVVDGIVPTASISPFYWNAEDDNSLYDNSRANGHIDLPGTWNENGDPAVSGKVVIRGTASDDKRISKLLMYIDSYAMGNTATNTATATANTVVQEAATYSSGAWTSKITGFTVKEDKVDQSGHNVEWEYVWDTSLISGVAKNDINIHVSAEDTKPNTTAATNYKVDVVPYIANISRPDTVTTNRSRYGRNPVIQGETITVTGFNFAIGTTAAVGATTDITMIGTGTTSRTMTVPAKSGYLVLTSNSVTSNNNGNDNDGHGDAEASTTLTARLNYYNRECIADTTTSLDYLDDRYLSVWNTNHQVPGSSSDALMPTFDFDNTGTINSAWSVTGLASIQLVRGLNETESHSIFTCYDQTTDYSAIGVEKSTGNMGVLFFPNHVGVGGMFSSYGLSSSNVVGGAGYIAIDKTSSVTMEGRTAVITTNGNQINPRMPMDGKMNTPYYPLQSHDMTRNPGSFSAPQSIRSGNFGHTLFYDRTNGSLKYTCIPILTSPNTATYWPGTMQDWSVIDGKATGQDRLHTTTETNNGKVSFRVPQNSHPVIDNGAVVGYYEYDIPNLTPSTAGTTSCTVELDEETWGDTLTANGATIAFLSNSTTYTDAYNVYQQFPYRDAKTIVWNNAGTAVTFTFDAVDSNAYNKITIYAGKRNAVADDLISATSAGEYSSIDLTSQGYPVIVYKAGTSIRLAYTTKADPTYADWTRQETGLTGGLYISMKIDTNNKLHVVYKDGSALKYASATRNADGSYAFGTPETIDTNGSLTMSTLSLYGTTPVVSYMNSESSEDGVKYAKRLGDTEGWDYQIVPAVVSGSDSYYVSSENYRICVGANPGAWNVTQDGIAMADCESFIGFKTTRCDVVFLKEE